MNTVVRLVAIFFLILAAAMARAEDDGEEMLSLMAQPNGREIAGPYVNIVSQKWNGTLFCIPQGDRAALAFDAVMSYLEQNPEQRYRPRRYLIIQGLRSAYPCSSK